MDWLNLHTSVLDSPECLRCDPVRRATWIWLLRYCIGQENGGVIAGCRAWGDTTWQQLCRVRLKEVNLESPLWVWSGDDLRVVFYPIEKQSEVQAKRSSGRLGGRPKGKPSDNHMVTHEGGHRVERAETEGKGREEEGKGSVGGTDRPLTTWIRTGTSDPQRTLDNRQALADLIKRFSLEKVQAAAERIVFAAHEKIWPDDSRLLAALIADAKPKAPPEEVLPDDLNTLPDGHPLKPKTRARA